MLPTPTGSQWILKDGEGKKKQGPLFKIVMISFPLFKGVGQLAMYINPYYMWVDELYPPSMRNQLHP